MSKKSSVAGSRWAIAKIIIAFICFGIAVYQLYAGFKMIEENKSYTDITASDYDDLEMDQIVQGEIKNIEGYFMVSQNEGAILSANYDNTDTESGDTTIVYCVRSDSGHLLAFRTLPDSKIDNQFYAVITGEADSVLFKGRVRGMTDPYRIGILNNLDHLTYSKKLKLDMPAKEALLDYMVDANTYDSGYSEKAIKATFVGAVLMFIIGCLFLVTIVKNAIISVLAEKGKYKAKLKVTKEDIEFEMQGTYTGNEENGENFFVNTNYNIRDYGVNKNNSPADKSQLPSLSDDPALNRGENDEPVFYTESVNDEGNFYVDSKRKSDADYNRDGMTKKY